MNIYVDKKDFDKTIRKIFRIVGLELPRRVRISDNSISSFHTTWSGGSREQLWLIDEQLTKVVRLEGDWMEGGIVRVPPELRCFRLIHTIFRGKDMGYTIYVPKGMLPKQLSPNIDLTEDEKSLLVIIMSLKSAYRRDEYYRKCRNQSFDEAKESLIQKGLLNRRGAITTTGKNLASAIREY